MRQGWFYIMLACLLFPGLVFAQIDPDNALGRPQEVKGACYLIWRSGEIWHLRWLNKGKPKKFTGKLKTPAGELHLKKRIGFVHGKDRLFKKGRVLDFQGLGKGKEKGFDFTWQGQVLVLDLFIDGRPAFKRVYIGADGIQPREQPFSFERQRPRHPKRIWVPEHYNKRLRRWVPGHWEYLP